MPELESLFWHGIRLQRRRGEEKTNQVPKSLFLIWRRHSKQGSYRQDMTPCQGLTVYFAKVLGCKGGGGKKKKRGPESLLFVVDVRLRETRLHRQVKPTSSQGHQPRLDDDVSESGWYLPGAVGVSHVCPRKGSTLSGEFRGT